MHKVLNIYTRVYCLPTINAIYELCKNITLVYATIPQRLFTAPVYTLDDHVWWGGYTTNLLLRARRCTRCEKNIQGVVCIRCMFYNHCRKRNVHQVPIIIRDKLIRSAIQTKIYAFIIIHCLIFIS